MLYRSQIARPRTGDAFTLIEMLVVITIIVVLATIVVPAAGSMLRGSQLTQSAQNLGDQLNLARQRALSRSRPVEVRFYQYADTARGEQATGSNTGKYRALQLFDVLDTGVTVPVGKVQKMLQTIVIDSGTLSTLLNQGSTRPSQTGTTLKVPLPDLGLNYTASVFRFRADGSTDLPATTSWYLTMHSVVNGDNLATPPPNFFTLQIDPANGSIHTFRP